MDLCLFDQLQYQKSSNEDSDIFKLLVSKTLLWLHTYSIIKLKLKLKYT